MSDIRWKCEKCGHWHNNGELKCSCCSKYESVAAVKPKHSHYHKDVSQYDTMDIYAICKVWNVESSGCTFAAVKKLLNAGERGAKDRITDLEQAIESIEALIKLVKMDVE